MYQLNDLFLLNGLSDEERRQVCARLTETVDFERGEIIYDETHFRNALGIFLSGKGFAGNGSATKAAFGEGAVFGAAALFGAGECYVSRIVAKTACRILFIPEDTLRALLAEYPVCAVNYVTFLSQKIRYLNEKIAQYTADNASAKLYRLLCDRADADGCVAGVNVSLLARLTGMGRTSIYRAIAELETNGLIERQDKNFLLRR